MNSYTIVVFCLLLGFWLLLTQSLYWVDIVLGILLSFLSIILSKQLLFRFHFSFKSIKFKKVFVYLRTLWLEMLKSGIRMIFTIVTGKMHVQIIHVPTMLTDDFSIFVLANSITLTPGTITLLRKGQTLIVLCLYALPKDPRQAAKEIKEPFEHLLMEDAL